jgi:hypothetical protein
MFAYHITLRHITSPYVLICAVLSYIQVYRHLNIGSNKPTPREMAAVPHHMVDMIEPHEGFSCGDFVRTAAPIIFDILDRGKTPGTFCCALQLYSFLHKFLISFVDVAKDLL